MQWWRKGLGWAFFAAALPHLVLGYSSSVSSINCDKNSSKERRRLSPSPMSACRGWRGGVNWAKLGEWGGLLGLWVTGLSGWGRAYQKEARPTTEMSIDLKILTSRFADHREGVLVRVPMDEGGGE